MNDELLMRFIDGTATSEEVETAMEMLSKDDQAAKEWLQMVQAARLADTPPAAPVLEHEAAKFVQGTLHKTETEASVQSGKVKHLPWILSVGSVAAALVLVLSLSLRDRYLSSGNGMGDDILAEIVTDTTYRNEIPVDTLVEEQISTPESFELREYVAEAETMTDETVVLQKTTIPEVSTAGQEVEFTDNDEDVVVEPIFNVVKPAKSPYRVKVTNVDKDFVFEWEAACVTGISLVITDSKGECLIDETMDPENGKCPVKAAQLANLGELTWVLTAVFEDDTVQVRTGKIEFVIN